MFTVRIGVLSDTHNDLSLALEVFRETQPLDMLLHAGDHYKDGIHLGERLNIETKAVVGNCDVFSKGPSEEIIRLDQHTILLTHGHKYGVKNSLQKLYYRSQEVRANIVVFGHTHMPLYIVERKVHFLNPGSLTLPRGNSKPGYGLITLEEGINIQLIGVVK
jgi:putative phosphoesterase